MNFCKIVSLLVFLKNFGISCQLSSWHESKFLNQKGRPQAISFKALDQTLLVGLDLLVPFVTVPLNRTGDADQKALVNVNTASVILSGLVALLGGTVGGLFRKLRIFNDNRDKSRSSADFIRAEKVLESFKLVQTNSRGVRSEQSLPNLIETISGKFRQSGVDLGGCVQKAICSYVRQSDRNVRNGQGSGFQKVVDGLFSLQWLLHLIEGTSLRNAIDAGRRNSAAICDYKYPSCFWSQPENELLDLTRKYLNFI